MLSRRRKAVLLALFSLVGLLPLSMVIATPAYGMTRFSSIWEMKHFLASSSCTGSFNGGSNSQVAARTPARLPAAYGPSILSNNNPGTSTSPVPQHSGTNNQVPGVDEPDTVKNDGHYLYLVTNNTLVILDAYPATNAAMLSRVHVNGTIQGIFIDGDIVIVLTNDARYVPGILGTSTAPGFQPQPSSLNWDSSMHSSVLVYDSADRSHLTLKTSVTVNGAYVDARLIDHVVYMIATRPSLVVVSYTYGLSSQSVSTGISTGTGSCVIVLPEVNVNGKTIQTKPEQVYHSNIQDSAGQAFTSIISLNTGHPETTSVDTFLVGTSGTIYASLKDIYLTMPSWSYGDETVIHRLSLDNSKVTYIGTGIVSGHPLNQFSMDEYGDNFRIATASSGFQRAGSWWSAQGTNLYVLDRKDLHVVGSLMGLSSGELFYSARFMADRAYLVTYRQTDPLFVVDLKNPAKPSVMGQLTIDGYSDYLQAYDRNHLIGIGKMAAHTEAKVSLFNVTDPTKPGELARYVIGSGWSQSQAQYDHKAVLLDPGMNLLVIPAETYRPWQYSSSNSTSSYSSGNWQGVYVFKVTDTVIMLKGTISHQSSNGPYGTSSSLSSISRELYIGNVLYTISSAMVKMNSLEDLHEINSVNL